MVTDFNMLESISLELILVPHICTSFDWSRATLKFIQLITIKVDSLFYLKHFNMYFFHIAQIPEIWYPSETADSFSAHQPGHRTGAAWVVGCYSWMWTRSTAAVCGTRLSLCTVRVAGMRCVDLVAFKMSSKIIHYNQAVKQKLLGIQKVIE